MAVWATAVLCLASLSLVSGATENVAQGKPAWMSTTRRASQSAGNAVDGVTTATDDSNSAHTLEDESSAWWKVDLQTPVQSPLVRIYFRTDYKHRRNGLQVYTSSTNSSDPKEGDLCYTVTGRRDGIHIPDVLNVTCPETWRYLTIYTETDNDRHGAVLDFAEVEVWACFSGWYGEGCSKSCSSRHCKTRSDTCDHVTGRCPGGCAAGYTGDDCSQTCESGVTYGDSCSKYCSSRHCSNTWHYCPTDTGACSACKPGWARPDCTACESGVTYGDNCSKYCSSRHCSNTQDVCPADTGACSACQPGWAGPDCTACASRRYGENCSKCCNSRHCVDWTSCPDTGACSSSGCQTGWSGTDCTACASGRYGDNCSKYCQHRHCRSNGELCPDTGTCSNGCQNGWSGTDCTECASGYYGSSCSQQCSNSHCKYTSTCGGIQWSCVGGCAAGYHGQYCTQACSSEDYGDNCGQSCAARHCKMDSSCDAIEGQCVGGCAAGYQEPDCAQACTYGHYGDGCSKVCSSRHCLYTSDCPPTTGACYNAACQTGWTGTDCTAKCGTAYYGANCVRRCDERHCKRASACDAIGQCVGGCAAGYREPDCRQDCDHGMYGDGCRKTCISRHCKTPSDTCHHVTGKCTDGCITGYTGDDCLQNCPDGYYGTNCSLSCAERHCSSSSCPADGACDAECEAGWTLPSCTQECPRGKYGVSCNSVCGHCADNTACHHITGTCPGARGCQAGWKLPLCQAACGKGTYGLNCERGCGHCNGTCDAVDGRCPWGCTEGYNGSHCSVKLSLFNNMQSSDVLVQAVAGPVVVLLVVAIIAAVVVLVGRRRRWFQNGDVTKHSAHFRPEGQENGAFANVVLDENITGDQKPPVKPKHSPQAGPSKQLEDGDQEEEDLNEEVQPPDSYYNAEAEDAVRDVAVSELAATVAMLKQKKDGFEREYNRLLTGFTATYQDSQRPENSGKNRFRGYYPYDHNRIRLTPIPDTPGSDYINASLIHSYNQGKTYIAAQAPNKSTVGDFWRMIWEHSCSAVVMLTGLAEEGKVKCEQYWPDAGVKHTEHFKVEVEATQIRANFTTRHMKVTSKTTGENRSVIQFHFTSWPDHGVPDTLALVQYIWLVRETVAERTGPLLVHCSAGIGRTGTYIAVDSLIDQARDEGVVDVLGYVTVMRGQRKNMVQTAAQYACVFHCLVEMTTFGRTSMDVSSFTTSYSSSGMDTMVDGRTLRELSQMLLSETRDDAPNRRRMWVDGNSDFTVHVGPTLTCVRGFLQAVAPSSKLVKLLWKLVEENNVHNIIVITPNLGLAEAEGRSKTHGRITVTTTSHTNLSADLSMMKLQLATKGESPRRVKMINADVQLTMETVTSQLLNRAELQNISTQTTPVVVVHSKTHEKLAVSLCIMGNILSGIRKDTRVDVIGHVRTFLRCSPGLQFTQSDVQMFHDFALQCIQRTDPANTYANV